jgi:hypothetical protein
MLQIVAFATVVAAVARYEKDCPQSPGENPREAARSANVVQYEKNC